MIGEDFYSFLSSGHSLAATRRTIMKLGLAYEMQRPTLDDHAVIDETIEQCVLADQILNLFINMCDLLLGRIN